jgi:hypothetical protein
MTEEEERNGSSLTGLKSEGVRFTFSFEIGRRGGGGGGGGGGVGGLKEEDGFGEF